MQFPSVSSRSIALLTGFVLASTTFASTPAHAMDKSKKLKYGAIAAGVAGAYLLSKGKTVPAAAVAGAGYYAYKKSEKARDEERYGSGRYGYNRGDYGSDRRGSDRDRYSSGDYRSRDNDSRNSGDVYPEEYGTDYRANAAQRPGRRQGRGNYDLRPYQR